MIIDPIDEFFRFPVRVYDFFSSIEAQKAVEKDILEKKKVEYAIGAAVVPLGEIVGWHDSYMSHRDVESVKENGFDSTLVITRNMGTFMSSWKRAKFEEEYNAYLKNMQEYFNKLRAQDQPPQNPPTATSA